MKTYIIEETHIYQIEANSEEEAEQKFIAAEDLNEFDCGVHHREVYQ